MDKSILLRIILLKPPVGAAYALQKGSGAKFSTEQWQSPAGDDIVFTCPVSIKSLTTPTPDFKGPYVQGPATERFVYIGIGTLAGDVNSSWQRRLKVPLRGITWSLIDTKESIPVVIETRIEGKDKHGGPTCATPKPFDGWQLVDGASH